MYTPEKIVLNKQKTQLSLVFNKQLYLLSAEFLRVHSPSAEVRGHHPSQAVLQVNKEDVTIVDIKPVGNYAVILVFSDGHDTGIYSWQVLYELATNKDKLWQSYLQKLKESGYSRKVAK